MARPVPFIAIILGLILFTVLALWASGFDPEADGVGQSFRSFNGVKFEGKIIRGKPRDVAASAIDWQSQGFRVLLWMGASQLHSISAARDGQAIAVVHANELAARQSARVRYVELSYGNANPHELLGVYLLARQENFRPDGVIVSIIYDDLREPGIRREISPAIGPDLRLAGGTGVDDLVTEIGSRSDVTGTSPVVRNAMLDTPQQKLETFLIRSLEYFWPGYENRQRLKGMLEITWKQAVARVVLGQERRNSVIIDAAKEEYGMQAFESLRRLTARDGIPLYIYRAPLLRKADFSYYRERDYRAFSARMESWCRDNGIAYHDFDRLIPDKLFGLTNSGLPDYFHFEERGHEILGKAVEMWTTRGQPE